MDLVKFNNLKNRFDVHNFQPKNKRNKNKGNASVELIRTSRDKERLRSVEMNTANRSFVLVESVYQSPHTIVP